MSSVTRTITNTDTDTRSTLHLVLRRPAIIIEKKREELAKLLACSSPANKEELMELLFSKVRPGLINGAPEEQLKMLEAEDLIVEIATYLAPDLDLSTEREAYEQRLLVQERAKIASSLGKPTPLQMVAAVVQKIRKEGKFAAERLTEWKQHFDLAVQHDGKAGAFQSLCILLFETPAECMPDIRQALAAIAPKASLDPLIEQHRALYRQAMLTAQKTQAAAASVLAAADTSRLGSDLDARFAALNERAVSLQETSREERNALVDEVESLRQSLEKLDETTAQATQESQRLAQSFDDLHNHIQSRVQQLGKKP